MIKKGKVKFPRAPLSLSVLEDIWLRRATEVRIEKARSVITGGAVPPNTPVGRLGETEWGWITAAVIFGWISVRAEQAVSNGVGREEYIRTTGLDPDPWDAGAIAAILPELAETGTRHAYATFLIVATTSSSARASTSPAPISNSLLRTACGSRRSVDYCPATLTAFSSRGRRSAVLRTPACGNAKRSTQRAGARWIAMVSRRRIRSTPRRSRLPTFPRRRRKPGDLHGGERRQLRTCPLAGLVRRREGTAVDRARQDDHRSDACRRAAAALHHRSK